MTGIWARGSSLTCSVAVSPRRKRGEQLRIAVDWGRYGELFDLDSNTGQLTLDQAQNAGAA